MQALLIDDRSWIREVLRAHISREWPQAAVREIDSKSLADDGRVWDAGHHDVIVLAQCLDCGDGLQVLRAIHAKTPGVPVVVVTERSDEASVVSAFRAGAADVLRNSRLDAKSVQAAIREALRGRSRRPRADAAERVPFVSTEVSVPGYEIRSCIARGPLSTIYLARSQEHAGDCALKILRGMGSGGKDAFERSLGAYSALSGVAHGHVVETYAIGTTRNDGFVAMEYLPGGSLRDRLREGPVAENQCLALIAGICDALAAIHTAGLLHLDLKPANVMLRADGSACLIDLGLASRSIVEHAMTRPGRIYGTLYYMSPEQAQGLTTDPRSDLYSLGILVYELLTGAKPYVASTPLALVLRHSYSPLPQLPTGLRHWQELIDRLLAKKPGLRPASASATKELLNHCKKS